MHSSLWGNAATVTHKSSCTLRAFVLNVGFPKDFPQTSPGPSNYFILFCTNWMVLDTRAIFHVDPAILRKERSYVDSHFGAQPMSSPPVRCRVLCGICCDIFHLFQLILLSRHLLWDVMRRPPQPCPSRSLVCGISCNDCYAGICFIIFGLCYRWFCPARGWQWVPRWQTQRW